MTSTLPCFGRGDIHLWHTGIWLPLVQVDQLVSLRGNHKLWKATYGDPLRLPCVALRMPAVY